MGTLLNIQQAQAEQAQHHSASPLNIVDKCIVDNLVHDNEGTVTAINTSRGAINVGDAKVVLSMGSVPPATLLMNSFGEQLPNAGKRYTGHFMSHITARVPRASFDDLSDLEIGAVYLEGKDPSGGQYHLQASVFAQSNPEKDQVTAARECPDAAAAPSPQQMKGSEDYVVLVCATLGEINENNTENAISLNRGEDKTTNINLQILLGDEDKKLWDVLDVATYQSIEALVTGRTCPTIEYWIDEDDGEGHWSINKPPQEQIRLNIIVHAASQLWMGKEPKTSVTGLDYRPHGVNNVYVTGGSIFPTSGSWNPTLTMCGFAQDLAKKLSTR